MQCQCQGEGEGCGWAYLARSGRATTNQDRRLAGAATYLERLQQQQHNRHYQ